MQSHSLRKDTSPENAIDWIRNALEHSVHLLPSQGPIAVFVHHNTLHAFEDQVFAEAAISGERVFRGEPYFSEARYRSECEEGRILLEDLQDVVRGDLQERADEEILLAKSRLDIRIAMLSHPILLAPIEELRWYIDESNALRSFRPEVPTADRDRIVSETKRWIGSSHGSLDLREDPRRFHSLVDSLKSEYGNGENASWSEADWEAFTVHLLWRICHQGAQAAQHSTTQPRKKLRLRDRLLALLHQDADLIVHDLLIRVTASYLDQGFASWGLPAQDQGLYIAFMDLMAPKSFFSEPWHRTLSEMVEAEGHRSLAPLESIARSLEALQVPKESWSEYVEETLLALPGWAGMVWQMETNADWTIKPAPKGSLEAFLAIRLLMDRAAAAYLVADQYGSNESLLSILSKKESDTSTATTQDLREIRAFLLFQVSQLLGLTPRALFSLTQSKWLEFLAEIEAFHSLERRRLFQLAYERHYRVRALDALHLHAAQQPTLPKSPSFQLITCIDDREESLRRHVEEVDPSVVTYGAAGFFSVPMYFRGVSDAHYIPLCPIVMKPQHYVEETSAAWLEVSDRKRAEARKRLGQASHQVHLGSRGLISGSLAAVLGSVASLPMVARVLFPRLTSKLREAVSQVVHPPATTQLQIERTEEKPGPENGHRGYSIDEMVAMAKRLLEDIGLTKGFCHLVIILGHGSSSLNNPHESAYNCGACGGGRGGPNARALADICNDARVRERLAKLGLQIPSTTLFIGGYHNTCDDKIILYDLERSPPAHRPAINQAINVLEQARQRNAHERCRRFESASFSQTPLQALRHVEARSEDLAQARPEYNHATNAMCIVGRRSRTRCLFLDRRSFLTSYDPTTDDEEASILNRILQAVIPVCGGISLEYYFSCVDPFGYGCGSKLPHNITSLLGVMEGAISDLRTGLSQQMVEIHEPLRILFVIETFPEKLLAIFKRNPVIQRMVFNQWVQVATLDPYSSKIELFQNGEFVPYVPSGTQLDQVDQSIEWYRGFRGHIGFAQIHAGNPEHSGL